MMAAMDGMAMPGMAMDGPASGVEFRAPGCPSNHCFQAIVCDTVTIPSRRGASVVLAATYFLLLKPTSGSLPALALQQQHSSRAALVELLSAVPRLGRD